MIDVLHLQRNLVSVVYIDGAVYGAGITSAEAVLEVVMSEIVWDYGVVLLVRLARLALVSVVSWHIERLSTQAGGDL